MTAANNATIPASFAAEFPAEAKWMEDNHRTFDFAAAMRQRAITHGWLTPGMQQAVARCMARDGLVHTAPTVDTTQLEAAFARVNPTLRKPAINVGSYRFSPAPAGGANPGAIYVKQDGVYLGKISRGKLLAQCTQEALHAILGIAADPLGKAIEHGKLTGRCAICNRALKAEDSTGRGIGPICAEKFGW